MRKWQYLKRYSHTSTIHDSSSSQPETAEKSYSSNNISGSCAAALPATWIAAEGRLIW